jgi:hypothetical protein
MSWYNLKIQILVTHAQNIQPIYYPHPGIKSEICSASSAIVLYSVIKNLESWDFGA